MIFFLAVGAICILLGIAIPAYEAIAIKGWPTGIWKTSLGLIAIGLLSLSIAL